MELLSIDIDVADVTSHKHAGCIDLKKTRCLRFPTIASYVLVPTFGVHPNLFSIFLLSVSILLFF